MQPDNLRPFEGDYITPSRPSQEVARQAQQFPDEDRQGSGLAFAVVAVSCLWIVVGIGIGVAKLAGVL